MKVYLISFPKTNTSPETKVLSESLVYFKLFLHHPKGYQRYI